MSDKVKKESKANRLLRMTVFIDKSLEPLFTLRFTPVMLAVGIGALTILLIVSVTLLIAFTGLREYIPGYPTGEERVMIMQNLQKVDSLATEIEMRDNMMKNLRAVLSGDDRILMQGSAQSDSSLTPGNVTKEGLAGLNREKSSEEASFISEVESAEKYDVDASKSESSINQELEATFFFSPLKGIVTDGFGVRKGHMLSLIHI